MSIKKYSEKEIEYVVRAFKMYAKKVVKHSAIDYARKVNSVPIREVAFTDVIEKNVSLSLFDSDTFFSPKEVKGALEDIIFNPKLQLAIKKLSKENNSDYSISQLTDKFGQKLLKNNNINFSREYLVDVRKEKIY